MNQSTFDIAIAEIGARLPAYFRRRVRDCATAEDLAQETLLEAYRSRETLRDDSRLEQWLYGIAHFTMVDHYRRQTSRVELKENAAQELAPASCEDQAMRVICCSARCYLETLPQAYRDPVHLADYEGLPHDEVAHKLGLSLAATKSRVRRGKLMVRNLMEARCRFEYDALGNVIDYEVRAPLPCVLAEK
ncbi:MAG: sigma-70 family RNA polymerase sigma factor [Verrucomicrobiota bacterium]